MRIVLSVVPKSSSRARFDSTKDFTFDELSVMIAEWPFAGPFKPFCDKPLTSYASFEVFQPKHVYWKPTALY